MVEGSSYDERRATAEFYDHVVAYQNRPDVPFYVEEARRSGGAVLELGCGTGRVLIPTARAGVEIVGLDASEAMLSVCRGRVDKEPEGVRSRVSLRTGDMRDFEIERQFALVTMPFRSFQHVLTTDDQRSCLTCIRRHLAEGGRLVFDVFNPSLAALTSADLGEELGDEPEFALPDGTRVTRRYRVTARDYFHQRNAVEFVYHVSYEDGREERIVHPFEMRYVFRYELEHLLVRSGFELAELYADFKRQPYGSTYPGDLIAVAEVAGTGDS
jgi:SAM-dependent methyltransferase